MKLNRVQNVLESLVHRHNIDPQNWPDIKPHPHYKPAALATPTRDGTREYHVWFTVPKTCSSGFILVTPETTPDGEVHYRYRHRSQEKVYRKSELYRAVEGALKTLYRKT